LKDKTLVFLSKYFALLRDRFLYQLAFFGGAIREDGQTQIELVLQLLAFMSYCQHYLHHCRVRYCYH
jgi:hypothetical protein